VNVATIIGIVIGMAVLGFATWFSTASALVFLNLPGLAIVLGGTAAATFICYPLKEVARVLQIFLIALGREELPIGEYIGALHSFADVASRGGTMRLEKKLPGIENEFLKDAMQMVVDGYPREEIREILDTRILQAYEQEMSAAGIYRTMSRLAPAFGIIGTLIGLIGMMQAMGADLREIGPAMATALTTTLYGILLANMVFLPIAVKVEKRIEERAILMSVIRDGVLLIKDRTPALIVLDKLKAYLPPRRWGSITVQRKAAPPRPGKERS
jgi:chemotaxis protein MotA